MSALRGYDHWLATTPEDEAEAAAERRARRDAPRTEPPAAREQRFACLIWNPVTRRSEPGTFTAHPDDFAYDPAGDA